MIQDRLEHIQQYAALGGNFTKAFAFLSSLKPEKLSEGRIEIDGESAYALVQSYTTIENSDAKFEAHRRYADIQLVVSGVERIDYHVIDGLAETVAYNPDKDIVFFAHGPGSQLILEANDFAIFFPQDAHAPKLSVAAPQPVLKVVVKVAL